MFGRNFDTERRLFDAEVDEVAAELVRNGMSPHKAIQTANDIVRERRIAEARIRDMEEFKKQITGE